jgi:hypothetical protein
MPNPKPMESASTRYIPWHEFLYHHGTRYIDGIKAEEINRICRVREVVPIIFVPGVMGSVLMGFDVDKGKNDILWDPAKGFMMLTRYGLTWRDASAKRAVLIGSKFKSTHLWVRGENRVDSPHKGWEGVSRESYFSFLQYLTRQKFHPLLQFSFYAPVHAFGYNWTDDNAESGKRLRGFITELIKFYRNISRSGQAMCEKVMVITHSMGGLVARHALKEPWCENLVISVVHGVQPVDGAPAAYRRMKAGFELSSKATSPKAILMGTLTNAALGNNGPEVSVLVGNMPGVLQLLPNKLYRDNEGRKDWLRFRLRTEASGTQPASEREWASFPTSNPYKEIYASRNEIQSLMTPNLLNPAVRDPKKIESEWRGFLERVQIAENFHDSLGHYHHPRTYYFYATGVTTADIVEFLCRPLNSTAEREKLLARIRKQLEAPETELGMSGVEVDELEFLRPYKNGEPWPEYFTVGHYKKRIIKPADSIHPNGYEYLAVLSETPRATKSKPRSGDGTVPTSSAKALGPLTVPGAVLSNRAAFPNVEHEPAYKEALCAEYARDAVYEVDPVFETRV